ncbi:GNAT family N-acetyltransferase [Falsiporphyromonas endometrii]|uniref:GNAT family N-acetyltransferase n=2 Tax=Falsiporphyromonas endometrii TaxID=1387297 RepID=A0ABV9K9Z8_9PORP
MTMCNTDSNQPLPIHEPIDVALIEPELTSDRLLRHTNRGGNEIYIFKGDEAPNTMKELGRLREEAFRFHGGGTGKALDIDEYDLGEHAYYQLIVWDPIDKAIIGGYRFKHGSEVEMDESGQPRLATADMFHFSDNFVQDYLPYTVELGRSFVTLAYQSTAKGAKAIFALDNLWDGIGALTITLPNLKYFYGKVTMYPQYDRRARNLILFFLKKHFEDKEGLIRPIEPLKIDLSESDAKDIFSSDSIKDDFKELNRIIRAIGITIPPLINAYMGLSPEMKVFGTAVNHSFGEVEETGIFIAIDKILEEKKKRHIESYKK